MLRKLVSRIGMVSMTAILATASMGIGTVNADSAAISRSGSCSGSAQLESFTWTIAVYKNSAGNYYGYLRADAMHGNPIEMAADPLSLTKSGKVVTAIHSPSWSSDFSISTAATSGNISTINAAAKIDVRNVTTHVNEYYCNVSVR